MVAIARDQVVLPVTEVPGKQIEQFCQDSPTSTQLIKSGTYSVAPREDAFARFAVIENEMKCVQQVWIQSMPLKDCAREGAL